MGEASEKVLLKVLYFLRVCFFFELIEIRPVLKKEQEKKKEKRK